MFYFLFSKKIPFLISLRRNHLAESFEVEIESFFFGFYFRFSFIHLKSCIPFFMSSFWVSQSSFSKCLEAESWWGGGDGGVEKDQHQVLFEMWRECQENKYGVSSAGLNFSILNPQPEKKRNKKKLAKEEKEERTEKKQKTFHEKQI